ncbi:hypothetical protein HC928_22570 [bacterium]|nr:hypothetical protein [bacterium]
MLNITSSKRICILALISVTLASPLFFYTSVQVDYAHGNQFFAVSLLLFLTVFLLVTNARSFSIGFLYGLATGLVFLVRWQDLVFGILVVSFARHLSSKSVQIFLFGIVLGLIIGTVPQFAVWYMIYDSFIVVPQGSGFLSITHMEPLNFFFSTWNGVFSWHPIMLIGFLGFGVLSLTTISVTVQNSLKIFFIASIIIIITEIIVSMAVYDWWSGGAFGQRRLVLSSFHIHGSNLFV